VPPTAEPLTVDIGQIRPRQGVVEDDGTHHPGQEAQDDDRFEYPEPVAVRRVDQRGQHGGQQQVAHHRDDSVVEQVRRAEELCLRVGGLGYVAVDAVGEFAVEDGTREQQSQHCAHGVPLPALVPPLVTAAAVQVADGQPEADSDGDAQEEVAGEDPQVLLARVGHAAFEADGQDLGDNQHDQRGQPGRPTRIVEDPPQSRDDAEIPRRRACGHVLTSIDQTSDAVHHFIYYYIIKLLK
jgi:hypothetical protein